MSQSWMLAGTQPLFTVAQWHELEHQAHIFKYFKAGLPVPPELLAPIQNSFQLMSSNLVHHPTLGYGSYYGKKIDPEPGRCRRTDGKKWRCSKDANPDSKYCERHINRRKCRSRKPVESETASQTLSDSSSNNAAGIRDGCGSLHSLPLNSTGSVETLSLGSNLLQLQMGLFSENNTKKEYSTIDTMQIYRSEQKLETDKNFLLEGLENARFEQNPEVDCHNFFQEDLVNARSNSLLGTSHRTWPDTSHVSSSSVVGSRNTSFYGWQLLPTSDNP